MHMGGIYHYLSEILTYVAFRHARIIILIKLDYDSDKRLNYAHHAIKKHINGIIAMKLLYQVKGW